MAPTTKTRKRKTAGRGGRREGAGRNSLFKGSKAHRLSTYSITNKSRTQLANASRRLRISMSDIIDVLTILHAPSLKPEDCERAVASRMSAQE